MVPPAPALPAAVFLDRDGTVIEDRHYLADPAGVVLLPGAGPSVARLNRAGIPVLLVTNQSGIGRGMFSEDDFGAVQRRMVELLAEYGGRLDGVYHCPHAPGRSPPCDCRKPSPGLFLRAAREHSVDLRRAVAIGDRLRDLTPALELGAGGILLEAGPGGEGMPPPGIRVAGSLAEAVELLLGGGSS